MSQNALEAKILRQTHVIEKGMSLTVPRPQFGVKKHWSCWIILMFFAQLDIVLRVAYQCRTQWE